MARYLCAVWECRYFWLALVRSDLRARYRGSMLGLGWSLLNPIIMTAILCTVFHRVFQVDIEHFVPYLLTGLAVWAFVSAVTVQGCHCFQQAEPYIRQFPAPLIIYPLRITLSALIHLLLALAVVIAVAAGLHGGANLLTLWALLPALVLLFVFGLSLAVLIGLSNAFFRDTKHLSEVGLPLVFYISPIMYEARIFDGTALAPLATYNPLAALIDLLRQPIVEGHLPELASYGLASGLTALVALAAAVCLARYHVRLIFAL